MNRLIFAVYRTRQDTALAINDLLKSDFRKQDISVMGKDKEALSIICKDTGLREPVSGKGNTGLFGEIKDLTASLMVRNQIIWATGSAAAKLAGAEIGTDTDGLVVSLLGLGVPNQDAEQYEELLKTEHIIVIVECSRQQSKQAQDILELYHCIPIH